jgi:hypothetical protein
MPYLRTMGAGLAVSMGVLHIKHDGFFADCSIKLKSIVKYTNLNKKIPKG